MGASGVTEAVRLNAIDQLRLRVAERAELRTMSTAAHPLGELDELPAPSVGVRSGADSPVSPGLRRARTWSAQ